MAHVRLTIAAGLGLWTATLTPARAQSPWQVLATGTTASFRGLSVVDDKVVWASGTRGTVLRSVDGGDHWSVDSVPGAAGMDLRAIHGRSAMVAHAAATSGRIWRTTDGGHTWSLRYQARDTSVFLDAIVFTDERHGMALGDPMGGRFLLLVTEDGGDSWTEAPSASRPAAVEGEAAFAASGTSLVASGRYRWLGTGGSVARILRSADDGATWSPSPSRLLARAPSRGVFSVAFADSVNGVAVGGDYTQPDSSGEAGAFSSDGGRVWQPSAAMPRGYRSGVAMRRLNGQLVAVAVGTSGSDISRDGGRTWMPLDDMGFNAIQFAPSGVAFAAGGRGRIARLDVLHLAVPTP